MVNSLLEPACVAPQQMINAFGSTARRKQDRQISAESLGVAHGVVGDVDAVPSRRVGVAGQRQSVGPPLGQVGP
jgi:hypothetical protein